MSIGNTPRSQSLVIASILLIVFVIGCLIMHFFRLEASIYSHLVLGVMLFGITFFLVSFVFTRYVERRVNPIYKTIHTVTMSQKALRKKLKSGDITKDLNDEVNIWASKKKEELAQLREMEIYRKDFLGNVSHELKTPIFNIQGYILTLLDGGMDDEKINKLYLERAEKSINRMILIVDDLVSISRLEAGEFKLQKDSFNIVKLVEDIFEAQDITTRENNIKLEFDRNYNKSIKVKADKKRITEVLNNLIVNSIKYGRSNGKTKVGFVDAGETILIDVSDDGIGIDEEDLPRIFERFYRVDKSRSRDSGGTGLGLSIVKHIIQAHNQTINVRSKVGKGTSFVFSLEKG